jgi:glycine oxidase
MNLTNDKFSDVLIVGGGVIGLSIARELQKRGFQNISILERGSSVGRESSHAAAGMLAPQAEAENQDDFFYFCRDSLSLYPQFAGELFDETDVDIELDQNGTLYLALTNEDISEIGGRFEWQKRAGLAVERLPAEDARRIEPFISPDVREALFFPNDWQVENRKLLHALQKYTELYDIEVRENVEVKNLIIENGKAVGAQTLTDKFYAERVVLATGAWTSLIQIGDYFLPFQVKPIRGQIIEFQTAKRIFSKVIYSPRGYLVPRFDGRVLAGATVEDAGFDKSVTKDGITLLREHALEIAPSLVNLEIQDAWAGLRPFAADGLPILGGLSELANLFIATAHYRNGILLAPATARILADKIAENKDSDYLAIFSPRRFLKGDLQALNNAA